jgi:squalene-hopene/tetraprenyl-beta-curcumene cyclase
MTAQAADIRDRLGENLRAAVDALFAAQGDDGAWLDTLPSCAVPTATSVVALQVADPVGSADLIQAGARWLRENQGADGGWGDAPGLPATLIQTPSAVGALAMVAPEDSAGHVRRGLDRIEKFGGMRAVADPEQCKLSVMCEILLALGGLHDENKIRRMPVELIFLPRGLQRRMSFIMPILYAWGVMQVNTRRFGPVRRALNRAAIPRIRTYLDQIEDMHGPDGGFEESPLVTSLVCLGLTRAGLWPDVTGRCVRYLRRAARPDGSWSVNRWLSFSATTWVTLGLQFAGHGADPRVTRTLAWMRAGQREHAFSPTGAPAGGWGWSVPSGWVDTDDTANALLCLAASGLGPDDESVRAGLAWLRAMQGANGSWSCFRPDSAFGLDAPCAGMTAHALLALREAGRADATDPAVDRAVRWFASAQRPDGAVPALWYRGLTAGTACTLEALGRLGLADGPTALACRAWLLASQQPDGGWGDGLGAPSTCEETAWALLGLLAANVPPVHRALAAAAAWLCDHQRADGLWDQAMVGCYFFDLTYSDDLLAAGYAVQALATYQAAAGGSSPRVSTGGVYG